MDDDFVDLPEDGEAVAPEPQPVQSSAKNVNSESRDKLGRFVTGHVANPHPTGRPNRSKEMLRFAESFLTDAAYRATVTSRIKAGEADHLELLLWHYLYGKPKDTLKLEDVERRPVNIVFLGGGPRDPMAEEGAPPRRALPGPPVVSEEVEFELQDIELPSKERPGL